jgi:hypothetical protein
MVVPVSLKCTGGDDLASISISASAHMFAWARVCRFEHMCHSSSSRSSSSDPKQPRPSSVTRHTQRVPHVLHSCDWHGHMGRWGLGVLQLSINPCPVQVPLIQPAEWFTATRVGRHDQDRSDVSVACCIVTKEWALAAAAAGVVGVLATCTQAASNVIVARRSQRTPEHHHESCTIHETPQCALTSACLEVLSVSYRVD